MKNIIVFFFILSIASCKQKSKNEVTEINTTKEQIEEVSEKKCITKILDADSKLGKERNTLCETVSLSETIKTYVAGMKALDFENCPQDFTKAFNSHIEAWDAMIPVTDNYPDLRGEMHDLFKELEKSNDSIVFNKKLASIWDTWAIVEERIK
ncbi:hypothetical protein [Patiriisocius hiemis]|uniref:Uncharacterized protein n=1 Tax=Patiriisocius hiemis TaxID=3075604 RepID=A0ABU2YC20_9FLAO|nr:hypothetical protein [Constantimarinum sp. W242]MDT0555739.1 hypothetical protein [Constantimarinum sp. W242]